MTAVTATGKTERARENRADLRRLLREKQPDFLAALQLAERQLDRELSGESPQGEPRTLARLSGWRNRGGGLAGVAWPASVSGSSTRRVVPATRGLSRKIRPSSASTRSLSPTKPVPPVKPAPPAPSSRTTTRSTSSAASAMTVMAEACACLAALASASETT